MSDNTTDVQNPVQLPEWVAALEASVAELKEKATTFYTKGTNKAGGDARKILQDIRESAKTGREHIQATRTAKKAKAEVKA